MKYDNELRAAAQSIIILINFEFEFTTPSVILHKHIYMNFKWLHFKSFFNLYIVTDSTWPIKKILIFVTEVVLTFKYILEFE